MLLPLNYKTKIKAQPTYNIHPFESISNLLYVPYETKLISVVFLTEISQINCCMSLKRVQLDLNQRILILQTSALPDFAMYSYINDRTITQ